MNKFTIDVKNIINERGAEESFRANPNLGFLNLREQEIELGKIDIDGKISNVGDGILVQAQASGMIILTCSRCVDKFKHPLNLQLNELYSFKNGDAEHKVEKDLVDISELIAESVSLNLDIKVLCKNDCAGLCPRCGINLNKENCDCKKERIDIRWHKLQELLEKKERRKR